MLFLRLDASRKESEAKISRNTNTEIVKTIQAAETTAGERKEPKFELFETNANQGRTRDQF